MGVGSGCGQWVWLYDGRIHIPLSMMQEHFNMEGEFPLPILTSVYVNGQVGVGSGCGPRVRLSCTSTGRRIQSGITWLHGRSSDDEPWVVVGICRI